MTLYVLFCSILFDYRAFDHFLLVSRYYMIYETLNIPIWSRLNRPQNFEVYATGKDSGISLPNPNAKTTLQVETNTVFIF